MEPWLLQTSSLPDPGSYFNTLYSAIKHIRSGFTSINYIHNPSLPLPDMVDDIEKSVEAFNKVGIRVSLSVPIKDQNFLTYDDETFMSNLPYKVKKWVENYLPSPNENLTQSFCQIFTDLFSKFNSTQMKVLLGPTGPQWCSEKLLETIKELSEKFHTSIHMHVLQTILQKAYGKRIKGKSLINFLHGLGLLDTNLTLGHAVWLTQADIELLGQTGTLITHHAGCNLRMRNGIAPLDSYLNKGIGVALGLDDKPFSDNEDIFQEMRLIALLHRVNRKKLDSDCLNYWDVLKMATENAAQSIGFGKSCGRIEPGRFADVILIDLERLSKPYLHPDLDIRQVLVHAGLASDVNSVIVGGKVIMRDRHIVTIDENQVLQQFRSNISSQNATSKKKETLWEKIKPYFYSFYEDWHYPLKEPYYYFNDKF